MTSREIWEGMLTELSKVNAPSMLLQDFNYFFNKAINQYINKRYNIYDVNQLTTDDLRVLKATGVIDAKKVTEKDAYKELALYSAGKAPIFGATYEVTLPQDYLHILNCICIYKVNKNYKCYNAGDYVQFAAKRLTADSWSVIVNDYYNRPLPERPYFYIHNINVNQDVPTNPVTSEGGTDMTGKYNQSTTVLSYTIKKADGTGDEISGVTLKGNNYVSGSNSYPIGDYVVVSTTTKTDTTSNSNFPRTISLNDGTSIDTVERETAYRYGNASRVRLEIRYGSDDSIFTLEKVFIDYIKTPQHIRLTQEQVNLTEDTSQIMEFPDYVCLEIINELTTLVMENTADPRLLTHIPVTTTIANPAQQLSQTVTPLQAALYRAALQQAS